MTLPLATSPSWAIIVVRVTLGVIFFAHGAQKVLGWFGGHGLKGTVGYLTSTGAGWRSTAMTNGGSRPPHLLHFSTRRHRLTEGSWHGNEPTEPAETDRPARPAPVPRGRPPAAVVQGCRATCRQRKDRSSLYPPRRMTSWSRKE